MAVPPIEKCQLLPRSHCFRRHVLQSLTSAALRLRRSAKNVSALSCFTSSPQILSVRFTPQAWRPPSLPAVPRVDRRHTDWGHAYLSERAATGSDKCYRKESAGTNNGSLADLGR